MAQSYRLFQDPILPEVSACLTWSLSNTGST